MKIFKNRFEQTFQKHLCEKLSLPFLINSSFPVNEPRERSSNSYTNCCRIDYMGLSCTTLLDIASNFLPTNIGQLSFRTLLDNISKLNENKIFVKIRFLFMYPYSTSLFSLIQAESSIQRSAVDSKEFLRDFRTVNEVDEATFFSSTTIRNIRNSLDYLQEIIQHYGFNEDQSPNTIRIRFTPVNVNLSIMIINDSLYYSPYLFAKSQRLSEKLALMAPVVFVKKNNDALCFSHFEDHFRYLWDLDSTMLCEDATLYNMGFPRSLSKIKIPSQVSFDYKASRIDELMVKQGNLSSPENEKQSWKIKVKHILQRYSTDTKPTPSIESLFIACSWEIGRDGKSRPNKYARALSDWLESDFGNKRTIPLMSIHVLEAATGGSLVKQIYSRLREATLSIIIMTKDIESKDGEFYTKSNVYHELGYLMHQLDPVRLVILAEEGVVVPSNINDKVNVNFQNEKLALNYRDIVLWLKNVSAITSSVIIENAFCSHKNRLDELIISGKIKQEEGDEGKRRIGEDIKNLQDSHSSQT